MKEKVRETKDEVRGKACTDVNRQAALIIDGLDSVTTDFTQLMRDLIADYRSRIKHTLPDALKDIMEHDYDILEKSLDVLLDGLDTALDRDLGRILYLVDEEFYMDSAFFFSERDPRKPSPHENAEQPAKQSTEAAS